MTYEAEVLADTPLIYWRLGEASGTTAVDDSGNSNDGTYEGSPTLGNASLLSSDPSNTSIVLIASSTTAVRSGAIVPIGTLSTFACECIFDVPSGVHQWGLISLEDPAEAAPDDIELYQFSSGGAGSFAFDFQGTSAFSPSAIATVAAGVHHFVGEYDGASVNLYVDGLLVDSQPFVDAGAVQTVANNVLVGLSGSGAVDGAFDEAAFYTHALGPTRVAVHAAAREIFTSPIYTVTLPDTCGDPAYSPNGTLIVFVETIDATSICKISRITTSGSGHTVLQSGLHPYSDPTYSEDGNFILFSVQTAAPSMDMPYGVSAIKYMNADGTRLTTVLDDGNANIHPTWATPTQIAFQNFRYDIDNTFQISVVDLAGQGRINLGDGEYPRAVNV